MDEDRFKRRAPARPEAVAQLRRAVVRYAQALEAPTRVVEDLRLAVSEALTNAVVHAYVGREPGDMVVEAWRDAGHLVVRVTDHGHGLTPRADSPGLGFGLGVMASVADELGVASGKGQPGTSVLLRFSLGGAAASCAR